MSSHTYYAQIDNDNIVTNVAVVTAEFMAENPERYPGVWVETFIDTDKTYAGVGFIYDPITQDFASPITPPSPPLNETPIS
jgi:hypothetical protein